MATRQLWQYGRFRRLLYSTVVNDLAQSMAYLVVPLLVLQNGGTPTTAGAVVAVVTACGIFAQFLSGYVADRSNPTILIRVSSLLQMASWLVLVILQVFHQNNAVTICLAGSIAAIFASVSVPSEHTIIQNILPESLYTKANVVTQGREAAANLLGNPFAGLLFGLNQIAALVTQAVFHVFSAVAVPPTSIKRKRVDNKSNAGREVVSGFLVMWRNRPLRALVVSSSIINLPFGMLPVVMISTYEGLGYSSLLVGTYMSMMGIGIVIGALFAERLLSTLKPIAVGTIALTGILVSISLTAVLFGHYIVSCIVSLIGGLMLPSINSLISSYTMLTTSPDEIGRVVAASGLPGMALMPLGSLLGGVLMSGYGTSVALGVAAIFGILAIFPLWLSPSLRALTGLEVPEEGSSDE